MFCPRRFVRQHQPIRRIRPILSKPSPGKQPAISRCQLAPRLVPCTDVLQLHRQHRTLESVHARVPAQLIVVVAPPHSLVAQHLHALRHIIAVCCHHARIARRAQVLRGIKTERRRIAQPAGLHSIPLRAPRLRGVFDNRQPRVLGPASKRPSRRQAIHTDAPAESPSLPLRAFHPEQLPPPPADKLNVAGSMSASTGVAPARRIALTEAKKLNGVVTTESPAPIPAPASASHSASVPDEQPSACFTPNCSAAARSNFATCSPRINCCVSSTCPSASISSPRNGSYCRFRSSIGTGVRAAPLFSPATRSGRSVFCIPPSFALLNHNPSCTNRCYQPCNPRRPGPFAFCLFSPIRQQTHSFDARRAPKTPSQPIPHPA